MLLLGSIPFVHNQPQRPVARGFPLFKCYEWLVSNWVVSKGDSPLLLEGR